MSTVSITCTAAQIQEIRKRYPKAQVRKTPPYAKWQIKLSDCVITAYESGKVVFQGDSADHHASGYDVNTKKKKSSTTSKITHDDWYPQCGSDEVGTGDYFGPVTVCAAYVKEEDISWLQSLGIQDSKAIKDDKIREIAPQLIKQLPHSLLVLDNTTYNRIHPTNNMVGIKCKLHNQAFLHLQKKVTPWPDHVIIDQFVQGASYYRYLQQEQAVVRNIHFETKAENKYLSVACGSIIARYAFLKAFDHMCEHYHFEFLKGASSKVDENIRLFVMMHGKEELRNVAKLHFANTKKAGIV